MKGIYKKLVAATVGAVASLATIGGGEALAFTDGSVPIQEDVPLGTSIQNGDFTITRFGHVENGELVRNERGQLIFARNEDLGNGIDETTSWLFDFTNHENFDAFLNSTAPIEQAELTLRLVPTDPRVTTDQVGIPTPDANRGDTRPLAAFGVTNEDLIPDDGGIGSITLDLLANDVYTSEEILAALSSDEDAASYWTKIDGEHQAIENIFGGISFLYLDDAGIVDATLVLGKEDTIFIDAKSAFTSESVPEPSAIAGLAVLGIGLLLKKKKVGSSSKS